MIVVAMELTAQPETKAVLVPRVPLDATATMLRTDFLDATEPTALTEPTDLLDVPELVEPRGNAVEMDALAARE